MSDRSHESRSADEARRLRLFDEPLVEAETSREVSADAFDDGIDSIDGEGAFEGELPDDLLALAERLTSESRSLAMTYPAGSPDRLPIGEVALAAEPPGKAMSPQAEAAAQVRDRTVFRRRTFGVGTAAAVGFAAIVGAAIYSAVTDVPRDSIVEIGRSETVSPSAHASPSTNAGSSEVAGAPVRTVSLSLADDSDYRRLEGLLRDRSEPEREAMFDLLRQGDGEATAVRIAF